MNAPVNASVEAGLTLISCLVLVKPFCVVNLKNNLKKIVLLPDMSSDG